MEISFYPIDIHYKIVAGRAVIYLYGRTSDGQQICLIDKEFQPYFYAIPKELSVKDKILQVKDHKGSQECFVTDVQLLKKKYLGRERDVFKIFVNIPKAVPVIKSALKYWNELEGVFEFDILFTRRYLIDKGITPMTLCTAEVQPIEERSKVTTFELNSIESTTDDTLTNPRILAIDIETYNPFGKELVPEKNAVLMIALYGENFKKVFTWKDFKTDNKDIHVVKSEPELIQKTLQAIEEYKPDIITGYFSDAFDLPYLKVRAQKHKMELPLGLDYSEMRVSGKSRVETSIHGIAHVDIYKFIRRVIGRTLKTDSYSLNAVANELLGEQKHGIDINLLAKAWDDHIEEHLEEFAEYNLQDAKLTYLLCKKLLPNLTEFVKVIGLPLYDINRMSFSRFVESYVIKQAHFYNEICLNKPDYTQTRKRRGERYAGGFVFEPKPGLYTDILLFDFRSLYPTIIASHNISVETIRYEDGPDRKKVPIEGNKIWFEQKKKGFIPIIIEDLITRRMRIKEILKKDKSPLLIARSQALKDLANSFYGYLGFHAARWYQFDCAQSVTAFGRDYVHQVIDKAREKGFQVLYGDTDSIFFQKGEQTLDQAMQFCDEINKTLPGLMELEFEGFYPSGIFVATKASEHGAKKRYALCDEEGHITIKGFETVRRNTSVIAKDVQREVLGLVLKDKDPDKALHYLRETVHTLRNHEIPVEKMVIRTRLSKDIDDYDTITPPVAAAQRMKDKGIAVGAGSTIHFVVGEGKGRIRDRVKLQSEITKEHYDVDYYLNNQILPVVERIFSVFGYKKEDLLESKDQKSLSSFFS